MEVKLVAITQPLVEITDEVEYRESSFERKRYLTPEEFIVYTARVSNPNNQLNTETAPKLLKYLIDNKHWSPYEQVDATFEITTSRAISAQIIRHRSFSFQEFSQRYAQVIDIEPIQLRKQAQKNRQGTTGEEFDPVLSEVGGTKWMASYFISQHLNAGQKLYENLISAGVGKEVARMVLPMTSQTKIYMKGSVRSWIHYLQIRTDEHTQKEHRDIALAIQDIFKQQFPNISEALGI